MFKAPQRVILEMPLLGESVLIIKLHTFNSIAWAYHKEKNKVR